MQFEIHITADPQDFNRWKELCLRMGANPLWIKNSKGWYDQQMLCAFVYRGSFLGAKNMLREMSQKIRQARFKIVREKMECQFGEWPSFLYNECHIKIRLPETENKDVIDFCEAEGISASWSLIHDVKGERKWYLTVRDYSGSRKTAKERFNKAIKAVEARFGRVEVEKESAIFDTKREIDKGWA